jgi:enoyl-CoA hydratase
MAYQTLLYETRAGIAYVTVNRPEKLNALNRKVMEELGACFEEIRDHEDVRAAILTGAGEKAFVAGADVNELAVLTPVEGKETSLRGQRVLDSIENLGKPVIAAVNGYALGGGCELAMACTLRVASENARFGQPEVKLGIIPGYAYRIGLVNQVAAAKDLIAVAEALARKIMANAPLAVKFALEAVNRGCEMTQTEGEFLEATLFGLCSTTADMKEGTRAFLEKRPPKFGGK